MRYGLMFRALLSIYVASVFLQSLAFKFTGSVETRHIFGTLDAWAAGFGLEGLFAPTGIAGPYMIGMGELLASALLLIGLLPRQGRLRLLGAALALVIISGAILFHLFTPLGIEVMGDHGLLFAMALGVWGAAAILFYGERHRLWRGDEGGEP